MGQIEQIQKEIKPCSIYLLESLFVHKTPKRLLFVEGEGCFPSAHRDIVALVRKVTAEKNISVEMVLANPNHPPSNPEADVWINYLPRIPRELEHYDVGILSWSCLCATSFLRGLDAMKPLPGPVYLMIPRKDISGSVSLVGQIMDANKDEYNDRKFLI